MLLKNKLEVVAQSTLTSAWPEPVKELCRLAGHPEPEFKEMAGSVVVIFRPASGSITPGVTGEVTAEVARLLQLCFNPMSRIELQRKLGLKHNENFRKTYIIPALSRGLIEMIIPDKLNSRLQKYRLTAKGKILLAGK